MNRKSHLALIAILALLVFIPSPLGRAEEMSAVAPLVVRTLEHSGGEVTHVEAQTISFLYARKNNAEYEMSLPLDAKVKLERYQKMSDIKQGDEVEIGYEKVVESPDTPEMRITMTVKTIRFVNRPKEGTMRSEDQGS